MKILKNILLRCLYQIFILSIVVIPSLSQSKDEVIKLEASVFARSLKPLDFIKLTGFKSQQTFFVKIENANFDQNLLEFIKIRNLYDSKKEKLPSKFFKSKKTWVFYLQRDTACDEKILDWSDDREILLYKKYEGLSPNTIVQCFLLKQKPVLADRK